jgi:hypothetical protein
MTAARFIQRYCKSGKVALPEIVDGGAARVGGA